MTSFYRRLALALTMIFGMSVQLLIAGDRSDPADLPSPITTPKPKDTGSLDDFGDGPIPPKPYVWLKDDPVTPTSPSTFLNYVGEYNDLDPNVPLERPGIPVTWFTSLELSAVTTSLYSSQQSESLLPTPFSVPTVPLNWNIMPKFTLGYVRPEGYGELNASYRFLLTQGTSSIPGLGGAPSGNISSRFQLHVLDLDYVLSDLYPTDLLLVPRIVRVTLGVRAAGIYNQSSANGGTITNQNSSNTFIGAGPRFETEGLYPVLNDKLWVFGKFNAAGVIGSDKQYFTQTSGGTTSSAWSVPSTTAVSVVGVKGGFQWVPDWINGQLKLSAGYQWEEWFNIGIDSTSNNTLMIMGPFLQGDLSF